jgi:hypothetical protein
VSIPLDGWLDLMQREYLASFIPDGGSTVRLAVAAPERLGAVAEGLRERGRAAGLAVIAIDTADTKLHLLQNLFFAIAAAIDWDSLIQGRLERMVADTGYRWPEAGRRTTLAAVAEANGIAPNLLLRQVSQQITRVVWQDARMTQDFRNAMMALLETRLEDDRDPLRDAVLEWLRGQLRRIAQVKAAQIGAKITRHNARAMLKSLFHWLQACGGRGVLVQIDISRLLRERRDVQDGVVYSPANVMDCYEVLRQMIDDADQMEGLFLAVLADPSLLSDDPRRSLNQYTALKMRVWDDVRPDAGDNPLAPLVVLQ